MRQEIYLLTNTLAGLITKCVNSERTSVTYQQRFGFGEPKIGKHVRFECWINLCYDGDLLGYSSVSQVEIHMEAVEGLQDPAHPCRWLV